MSSIRESLTNLRKVFTSTRRMKLFLIWLIFALFLEFLSLTSYRDEYQINQVSFLYNIISNMILKFPIDIFVIFRSIILSSTLVRTQTNAIVGYIAIWGCLLSSLFFWLIKESMTKKVEHWNTKASFKFILFGSLGAIWVEFLFWLFEKLFNTVGVAANPNFILDLLVTMPWYITMVALVWVIHRRYSYSLVELAFLAGFYEFISPDGVMRYIFTGEYTVLLLLPIAFPMYILIYSFILIPPTIMNRNEIERINSVHLDRKNKKRFIYGLIPLLGLIPYAIIIPFLL